MKIVAYINKTGKIGSITFSIVLVFLIGLLDYIIASEISLSILYLFPISVIAWMKGKNYAIFIAFLSACVWAVSNGMTNQDLQIFNTTHIWNTLVRLGFFIIITQLLDKVINFKFSLEEKINRRTEELSSEILARIETEKELKKKSEKLSLLTKRIQNIREEENIKIAREIHDELGQALTAIKIETVALSKKYSNDQVIVDRLYIVTDIVENIIKTIRKISIRLRPRLLDELGLIPAIEFYMKDFKIRTGINYRLNIPDENFNINNTSSNNIFRIFQEAITNIIRYSQAKEVTVKINKNGSGIFVMEIKDNGIGLPEEYMDKIDSLGIIGMKERANMLKGTVDVLPGKDSGTEVILKIPLN